jgi:hypothetical protein
MSNENDLDKNDAVFESPQVKNAKNSLRPTDFGQRGMAFWNAMDGPHETNPQRIVLLVEIGRALDTLDQIHRVINGDETAMFSFEFDGAVIECRVDKVLIERRLTWSVVKNLIGQLDGLDTEVGKLKRGNAEAERTAESESEFTQRLRHREAKRAGGAQ